MPPRFPIEGVRYRPRRDRDRFIANGDWIDMTAGDALRRAARTAPEKTAVVGHDRDMTFAELDAASEAVAAGLLDTGLAPGDRAMFQIGNIVEFFPVFFGCCKAGIVPVCTLAVYRQIEMEALARRSGARAFFVQADVHPTFDQLAFARSLMGLVDSLTHLYVVRGAAGPGEHSVEALIERFSPEEARERVRPFDPDPQDVIAFQMSGGSTGLPKLIPRFHAEYLGSAAAMSRRWELDGQDKALWMLPLIHNAGALIVVIPMALDCRTSIIMPRFEVTEFLETVERREITFSGSIGPVAPRLLEFQDIGRFDFSKLRHFFALSRADAVEAHTGVNVHQMFGITEGLLMGSAPSDTVEARHRTVGFPVAAADEVRVLAPGTETDVATDEVGELCFRGPSTLTGYFGDEAATAAAFTSDGFFRTGDLVRSLLIGNRTHYAFEGRIKDNINRGGEKIGAEEVENVVAAHPAVADVRVVAMPDEVYGEKVCAFIIVRPGFRLPTVAELGEFLTQKGLARYKSPERIEAIDAFPVTSVGKVDKVRMRQMIADRVARESNGEPDVAQAPEHRF